MAKRKPTLSKVKNKAWTVFSKYIRLKYADFDDNVKCVTCGATMHWKKSQAGHFIPGRTNSILFEEKCVHPQCYRCNMHLGGNIIEYYDFMLNEYGQKTIDELKRRKNEVVKYEIYELEAMMENWNEKINALEHRVWEEE